MRDVRSWIAAALAVALASCATPEDGERAGNASVQEEGAPGAAPEEEVAPETGPLVPIRVKGIEIQVEIADDDEERARGLMFRESLPENQGMLFVYESERRLGFWMRNTLIPLDIAYADSAGRIVDIRQLEPQSTETIYSSAPAMYALEMNQGWFEAHEVRVGDRIEF